MDRDRIRDLAAAHVLGALDDADRRELEALIRAGDPEVLRALREMQEVSLLLPHAAEAQAPRESLKSAVLAAVAAAPPETAFPGSERAQAGRDAGADPVLHRLESDVTWWRRISWGFAGAAAVILIASLMYIGQLRSEKEALATRLQSTVKLVEQLESEINHKNRILNVVNAPAMAYVPLQGTLKGEPVTGRMIYSAQLNQGVFLSNDLQPLSQNRDYQLWAIKDGKPVRAGIIELDESGVFYTVSPVIPDIQTAAAFAVTVEPAGGSPQPTTTPFLVGSVKG